MQISKVNLVYFSATYTTLKVVEQISSRFNMEVVTYDITQFSPETAIQFGCNELVIFGMPVYSSRIPTKSATDLKFFKGNNTPAIITCVYGNRDYDDALLELQDITTKNGFNIISAGAFIGQHSIFPTVGTNRPDSKDIDQINKFADQSIAILNNLTNETIIHPITIKGSRPYKTPGKVSFFPEADDSCNKCGTCAELCPVGAVPIDDPSQTDSEKCIACGRCIVICPEESRHFSSPIYPVMSEKFTQMNSERKEPECLYIQS